MRTSCRGRSTVAWFSLVLAAAWPAAMSAAGGADDVAGKPPAQEPPDAADPPADQLLVNNQVGMNQQPVMNQQPAAAAPAAPPPRIHPQVNMAGFTREYRPVPMDVTEADVAIRAALDRPIDGVWEFEDVSLRAAAARLQDSLKVPVVLDEAALTEAGIDLDGQTVTTRLSGISTRAGLRVLFFPFDVTYVAADETLTVTTRDKACERLTQVAYPLPRWSGLAGGDDATAIIDLVQCTAVAQTWDTVGGPASIRVVEAAGEPLLMVSQTAEGHVAVERLLRALHGRWLAEFEGGGPVLKVHKVADDRARADLERRLKDICNETLGDDADPDAEVTSVAATLAVRSKSPRFHALAAQVVASVAGVERHPMNWPMGGWGGGIMGNPMGGQ